MKKWLCRYRKPLVAVMCVAFLVSQMYWSSVRAHSVAQIAHIKVNTTTTKFVQPLSPMEIAHVKLMSRFASLLTPLTDLPKNDWLLDDSTALEFPVYLTDAVAARVITNEGDGFNDIVRTAGAFATMVGAGVTALTAGATAVTVAITVTHTNTPTAAAAGAGAGATAGAAYGTAKAATTFLNAQQAANEAAGATATQAQAAPAAAGIGYNPDKIRDRLAQKKRDLMLSLELDG